VGSESSVMFAAFLVDDILHVSACSVALETYHEFAAEYITRYSILWTRSG
jgi:hypothetical protein